MVVTSDAMCWESSSLFCTNKATVLDGFVLDIEYKFTSPGFSAVPCVAKIQLQSGPKLYLSVLGVKTFNVV